MKKKILFVVFSVLCIEGFAQEKLFKEALSRGANENGYYTISNTNSKYSMSDFELVAEKNDYLLDPNYEIKEIRKFGDVAILITTVRFIPKSEYIAHHNADPDSESKDGSVVISDGLKNGHQWVDLGLSVKWATCNIGATKPEEYGDYYSWGEVYTKSSSYNAANYKWESTTIGGPYKKYDPAIDNNTILEPADDVAHVKWGGTWRMPTKEEMDELLENCTWEVKYNFNGMEGLNGYLITSKVSGYTDRSIFLPAAGYRDGSRLEREGDECHYWSSSLQSDYPYYAYELYLYLYQRRKIVSGKWRSRGNPVRPVCP